ALGDISVGYANRDCEIFRHLCGYRQVRENSHSILAANLCYRLRSRSNRVGARARRRGRELWANQQRKNRNNQRKNRNKQHKNRNNVKENASMAAEARYPRRPDNIDVEVGRLVRVQRIARGLSQTELGNQIGVTFQQVQKYESGANRISMGRLTRIG